MNHGFRKPKDPIDPPFRKGFPIFDARTLLAPSEIGCHIKTMAFVSRLVVSSLVLLTLAFHVMAQSGGDKNQKAGAPRPSPSFQLNVQSSDPDAIRAIVSAMDNSDKGEPVAKFELTIVQPDLTNKDAVAVDSVYHVSFFKPRYGCAAIGFENYFKIKDFGHLKASYLDHAANAQGKLVLFVNGQPFPEIKLHMFDECNRTISFLWVRDDSLTKVFSQSYISKCNFRIKKAELGFGYYNPQTKIWTAVGTHPVNTLYVIKRYAIAMVIGWSLLLVFIIYYLGRKTNMLRVSANINSPFSLALTQFAFWTIIIFTSFFYLWIVSFELVAIPDSTLALLGITALTTAGSKVVDINKSYIPGTTSKGFIADLLSEDGAGFSIHRCQLFMITLLFGGIYIFDVLRTQSLPDFGNSLLWLIGISSGTFIGIKSVEGRAQTVLAANQAMPGQANPNPPNNNDSSSLPKNNSQ